jgi:hypothetical protein
MRGRGPLVLSPPADLPAADRRRSMEGFTFCLSYGVTHLLDPVNVLGYVLAGLAIRQLWLAMLLAIAWYTLFSIGLMPAHRGQSILCQVTQFLSAGVGVLMVVRLKKLFRKKPKPQTQTTADER